MTDHSDIILQLAQLLYGHDLYIELGVQDCITYGRIAPLFARAIGVDILDRTASCREFFLGKTDNFFESPLAKGLEDRADLIFIDADHEASQVYSDTMSALRLLKPKTGLVLLHDTYPEGAYWTDPARCHNAWEAAERIRNYLNFETITLPLNGIHGLTVIRKFVDYKPHTLPYE